MNCTNIKRKFSLLIVVFLVLLSAGCVPGEISQWRAKKLVVQNLEEKYGGEFEVRSVESKNVGSGAFKDHIYEMEVYSQELNGTFEVDIYRDGSRMNDGYEELKYGKQIEDEINSIKYTEDGWTLQELDIYHSNVSDESVSRNIQDYKNNAEKLMIELFINITNDDIDGSIAISLFKFLNTLQQSGYRFSVQLKKDGTAKIINERTDDEFVTIKQISKALKKIGTDE